MNEVITLSNVSYDQLAQLIGQSSGTTKPRLPVLKINNKAMNSDEVQLPMGQYHLSGLEVGNIFSKTVTFRPFINTYQYIKYDPNLNKFINKCILFTDFSQDAPDELGGNRCGKITGKAKENMDPRLQSDQKMITCVRNVFGLVTITGRDLEGKPGGVKDYPCVWKSSGSAFMAFGDALKPLVSASKLMINYNFEMATKKNVNGSVIFYTPVLSVDVNAPVTITQKDIDTLNLFKTHITDENSFVYGKFKKASKPSGNIVDVVATTVDTNDLANDFFNDSLEDL